MNRLDGTFWPRARSALDETRGQIKLFAQAALAASHLPVVRFVIEPGEMQQTMEQEDFQFHLQRVTESLGLTSRGLEGDGKVARVMIAPPCAEVGWGKGQDICRLIHAAKFAVELADVIVVSEQYGYGAGKAQGFDGER